MWKHYKALYSWFRAGRCIHTFQRLLGIFIEFGGLLEVDKGLPRQCTGLFKWIQSSFNVCTKSRFHNPISLWGSIIAAIFTSFLDFFVLYFLVFFQILYVLTYWFLHPAFEPLISTLAIPLTIICLFSFLQDGFRNSFQFHGSILLFSFVPLISLCFQGFRPFPWLCFWLC